MSRSYKITLLIALYTAQGLPLGFFSLALPILLREAGHSLTTGALSSLALTAPWLLKFLWASYLDHTGTRRRWLIGLQLASICAALALTQANPSEGLTPLFIAGFIFSTIAASQDVITDGLAVRMLDAKERGLANAIQVGAYRFGMILGGGALLLIFSRTNWEVTFLCMAGLLTLTLLPALALQDPPAESTDPKFQGWYLLIGWFRRLLSPGILRFALVIVLYRFGDQMVATLLGPFLFDQGMDKEGIALLKGTVGSATSLFGAVLGGWLAFSAGRRTAILTSGIAQAASYTLYIVAALGMGGISLLWVATIFEGIIGTMATVALFTLMMDASDPEHAGTDYTLFASLVVLMGPIGNLSGAFVADKVGYMPTFTIGTILALLGTLIVVRMLDNKPVPARIAAVWQRAPSRATR
ncbi:MFS transporter [Steroidobacter sp.]|uniref:MFS transporter n=1 Tax=Steroidobacter sp. TaxID=1978227 RepID=UPI001A57D2BC|nr:MFS transporter [Steroidobacter sp.]MBL8265871.1 MFS transporter [Steroidobacter sp.]